MYQPDADKYSKVPYAQSGRSGLDLPRVSLGLWHNRYAVDGDINLWAASSEPG